MGMLHLMNGTVIDYFSKQQLTVETATYGPEFVAARAGMKQKTEMKHLKELLFSAKGESVTTGGE